MRVFSIDSVQLLLQKSNPPKLAIQAVGRVTTTGWTNVRLERLEETVSPDGILDLEMTATPPDGISMQVLTQVSTDLVIDKEVDKIIGVQIHARTNTLTEMLNNSTMPGAPIEQEFTTLAVGEETPWPRPPITTFAVGEEGWPKFPGGEFPPWKPVAGEKPPGFEDIDISDLARFGRPFGRRR